MSCRSTWTNPRRQYSTEIFSDHFQSWSGSIRHSINQSISQSMIQSIKLWCYQSINQAINRQIDNFINNLKIRHNGLMKLHFLLRFRSTKWFNNLINGLRDTEPTQRRKVSGLGIIRESDVQQFGERTTKQIRYAVFDYFSSPALFSHQ